jgi:hypothetical protein
MDSAGYPDRHELDKISEWASDDNWHMLMDYILELWKYARDGYFESRSGSEGFIMYEISTAGWSGNEDIISAMSDNILFWSMNWFSSMRGGHYKFKIKKDDCGTD